MRQKNRPLCLNAVCCFTRPVLQEVLTESLDRANSLSHLLASGTAWAAMASYHQFYSNGNKRMARYVMNAVLLSHGFDAIVTPAARRAACNQTLRDMCIGGDVTMYALYSRADGFQKLEHP